MRESDDGMSGSCTGVRRSVVCGISTASGGELVEDKGADVEVSVVESVIVIRGTINSRIAPLVA